jgi:hypothetical protein
LNENADASIFNLFPEEHQRMSKEHKERPENSSSEA